MTQGAVKTTGKRSRAVSAKKKAILSAALDTFSQFGFHGTRLEQIAELAGVSKTNLLYYFPSKEALYIAVLRQILDIWLAPLKAFREDFAPLAAIKEYIRLKLEVSRDYPQASRLFCMEMLQGAPNTREVLTQFHAFCKGACLVAHNAEFDMSFIRFHAARFNLSFDNLYADTLMLSRYLMHDLINHKLDTLCEALFSLEGCQCRVAVTSLNRPARTM